MAAFDDIAHEVLAWMASDPDPQEAASPAAEARFDALARAVFAFQYRASAPYRAFCDRRGRTPATVARWQDVPAVPTTAFKSLELACAPPARIFLTSGTTQGGERRGRHLVPRLDLYRTGALVHFRRMVLPDGMRPRMVGLLGGPAQLPDSSLSQMVEWLREDVAGGDGEYLVDDRGFDPARVAARIDELAADGRPLCLIGVRVLFTSLLEWCAREKRSLELPADSRVVDTGGSKGGRALSDAGFLAACWSVLGVPGYYCVNEYGMTELCSQFYDDVLAARFAGENRPRRKLGPAWVRTLAVDPATLAPVPDGEPGLLCHFDLANAGSVLAVQTEDVGIVQGGRFRLLGRAPGAEPRGCALALADLLAAAS
ncbi:MAG: long-chain fatty acid--CoA ligase [Thermodesulfobacteriota bacterium]